MGNGRGVGNGLSASSSVRSLGEDGSSGCNDGSSRHVAGRRRGESADDEGEEAVDEAEEEEEQWRWEEEQEQALQEYAAMHPFSHAFGITLRSRLSILLHDRLVFGMFVPQLGVSHGALMLLKFLCICLHKKRNIKVRTTIE